MKLLIPGTSVLQLLKFIVIEEILAHKAENFSMLTWRSMAMGYTNLVCDF